MFLIGGWANLLILGFKKTCYLCRDEADALEEVSSLPGQYRYMTLSSKKYQPADCEAMTFPEKFFISFI